MTSRRDSAMWMDLQIAGMRWVAYGAAALGFALAWLIDPQRAPFPFDTASALVLIGSALLGNAVITGLAYGGWLQEFLPAGALVFDVLLAVVAYILHGPASDAVGLAADPLYFIALLPVITAAIRFHWAGGVSVGLVVGLVRMIVLLWGMPGPFASANLLPALFGLFFLLGAAFLSGFLVERVLRQEGASSRAAGRGEVESLRAAAQHADALQEMTSALTAPTSFERVLELALDAAEGAMTERGAKGGLLALVFLFGDGEQLRLVTARHLPRYDLATKIRGESGIVAMCLEEGDAVVSQSPQTDPELCVYTRVADCKVAAAVPLRAGFESYGAMVFASDAVESFSPGQLDFFSAIAGRATIALHNAMLYQNLQAEKDRIVAVEEEARRKLSRDLHDGPTQAISAIAMRLSFVRKRMLGNPRLLESELETIEKLALQTVKEIRRMLFALRPLVLETEGLVSALQSLADRIQETDKLELRVQEVDEATNHLDSNQAGVVFYLVEEALGNARKHSQASLVDVRMSVEEDLFVARVTDNGVGFDPHEVVRGYESRGSLGMVNMRERAELINASMDIKSSPGQGTTVTFVVPLQEGIGAT